MILRWFDTAEVEQFAVSICADYVRLRKSTALRGDNAAKRVEKFSRLKAKVDEFASSLNFYKKAKLIQEMRSGLEAQQIPQEEIAAFIRSIMMTPISS